jgi:hypothetical protein
MKRLATAIGQDTRETQARRGAGACLVVCPAAVLVGISPAQANGFGGVYQAAYEAAQRQVEREARRSRWEPSPN